MQSTEHDPNQPPTDDGETITVSPCTKTMFPTIHFVETASSVLRELPWILPKEYKVYTKIKKSSNLKRGNIGIVNIRMCVPSLFVIVCCVSELYMAIYVPIIMYDLKLFIVVLRKLHMYVVY